MPLGGDTIGWNEASPANTDLVGQGDDQMRSIRSNVRAAMDSEHNFPSTGGANSGYHRYGSARPFVEPASRVSSSGTAGRLIFNSTDSTFWNSGAAAASLIGGPQVLMTTVAGNAPSQTSGAPNKFYNLVQYGTWIADGTSNRSNITFASAYSGIPMVFASVISQVGTGVSPPIAIVYAVNQSGFSGRAAIAATGNAVVATQSIQWMSIGTVNSGLP